MTLFAKTVAERTRPGQRQDVEEQDYTFHAYGRSEGICGIIISDHAYPALVAHQLLSKVVDEFLTKHPRASWATGNVTLAMPDFKSYMDKYQDPQEADSIMKIQKELDETKIVLHKTIESVLQRGEKIDDLVAKSDGLSAQSKMFYREWTRQGGEGLWADKDYLLTCPPSRTSQEAELLLRRHVVRVYRQIQAFCQVSFPAWVCNGDWLRGPGERGRSLVTQQESRPVVKLLRETRGKGWSKPLKFHKMI